MLPLPEDLVDLWWNTKLRKLGNKTPNELWDRGEFQVIHNVAKGYLETWFS